MSLFDTQISFEQSYPYKFTAIYRKYGVVVLGGITRSQSGTALKSLGSLVSASEKASIEAMFPQR